MSCRTLRILVFLLCPLLHYGQDYSYSRYDNKDGLAGSTVYCMTQDRDGFIWFGTETGLSRYDGSHFKNFTREDGLPDYEIIQLFSDSKGRVWISPFRKTVCYYYKGSIHNNENDTVLKKLRPKDNVIRYAEDNNGNMLLQETGRLHLVTTTGEVTTISEVNGTPIQYVSQVSSRKAGGFWVVIDEKVYAFHKNRFTLRTAIDVEPERGQAVLHFNASSFRHETLMWRKSLNEIAVLKLDDNKTVTYPYAFRIKHINFALPDAQSVVSCTRDGAYVYNLNYPDSIAHFLPGIPVSNMLKDSEGNWWFSTFGKGVYRLNSAAVRNLRIAIKDQEDFQVMSFVQYKNWVLAASTRMVLHKLQAATARLEGQVSFTWPGTNPKLIKSSLGDNSVLVGTNVFLVKLSPDLTSYAAILNDFSVKALCTHKNTVLAGNEKCVLVIDQASLTVQDTLWRERATCLFSDNDTIYIGTLNGLYQMTPDKKVKFLGEENKVFQSRIAAVCEDDNHVIWVATIGDGLVAWRNGKVLKRFTHKDGLTSDICRALFSEGGQLWIGTDKGLNKINVLQPGYPVQKYTSSDGLSSDIINAIYVYNKKVYVGTPEGVTFFDEEKMASQSQCNLQFVDITIDGQTYHPADAPVLIPHKKNNIQFNYVGISYKSAGDIRYRYRLLGLDSAWLETKETFLHYPTLPSGDYSLELQAINKFGIYSKVLTTRFTIDKLLYERTWFRILIGVVFLAATTLLVWLIIQRIRKREQEKTATNKRISELEQLSRKAQMNPHFIFNSLNSIQQYVMDADVAGANKFISGFSRLIRQTLDFSSKPEISLEEELDYLTNYLDIERTRLENTFSWAVDIDDTVNTAEYYIPPMILQPFVENSVRHGLRFRRDKEGKVIIKVKRECDHLVCILEDNGVGRKAAMKYKSVSPINYQSKGMSLTADRIDMFNKEHEHKITMQIDDLEDSEQNALGTRVTICFPVL
jgi:ligand-binding sensor domain-containing protein